MTDTHDLLPIGLEDRLPGEARILTHAMRAALETFDSHGYDRVQPPLIEFEDSLKSRMEGVETNRMVRFVDPESLRTLALRSDMTMQVGRIAATSMADAPRPLRLCYAGDVAVIRANQLDPSRQRQQIGAELIGSDSVAAAREAVSLAIEAVTQAGAQVISVDLTLPDVVSVLAQEALPLEADRVAAVRHELDTKDAGGLKAAGGEAYLPLLHAAGPFEDAVEKLTALDAGGALASRIEGLRRIAASVPENVRLTLDPSERHGFEYQSWFGFTVYANGPRKAVGRGGTYCIGGSGEVATGFSLFGDALIEALSGSHKAARPAVFLADGHDRAVARRLREEGWRTVAQIGPGDNPEALGCTHRLDSGDAQPRTL